jgi:hypothetical protein
MYEAWGAALVLVLLLGGVALGLVVRPLLSEAHRSRETTDLVQLVITMLVTFAALVLGLLTSSVKASFDTVDTDLRGFSIDLIRLDQSLREYGEETAPIRALLRGYTAAAIATTWRDQPAPPGDYYPRDIPPSGTPGEPVESAVLGTMLDRVEIAIRSLEPRDPMHRRLLTTCINQFERFAHTRWKLIEEAHSSISMPFYLVLSFWLVIVFASFGLSAPKNAVALITMGLGALSIASVIFVILELDSPLHGLFTVSSQPLRDALVQLNR